MEFNTVMDISSIIWDESKYENSKHHYHNLLFGLSILLLKFEKEKLTILLREELIDEMRYRFPSNSISREFRDIKGQVYSFLSRLRSSITYPDKIDGKLVSIPNLIKEYYSDTAKKEVCYLISRIHSDNFKSVYFTFEYLWEGNDNLKTQIGEDYKEYETIITDNENDLDVFFTKIKPTFEHNPKHDRIIPGDYEARLSCFDGMNTAIPQKLLDKSMKVGDIYYNYDSINDVWVIFRCHLNNIFHGYDENDLNRIPNEIRKKLNK